MQFRYGTAGKFFFLPPQHFREKFFRCPFQYPKVPLEAGAPPPPIFWCFLRPCSPQSPYRRVYPYNFVWQIGLKSNSCRKDFDKFTKILLKNFTNYGKLCRKFVKNVMSGKTSSHPPADILTLSNFDFLLFDAAFRLEFLQSSTWYDSLVIRMIIYHLVNATYVNFMSTY